MCRPTSGGGTFFGPCTAVEGSAPRI